MADEGKEFPDEFSPVPTPLTGSERILVEKGTATIDDVKAFARTNLPAPSAASDAATKGYVDDRLPELEWWDPVWTPVSNVDSVSNVECSYTRVHRAAGGSLVTLEGTVEVTSDAAGQCVVQVDLPIARVGSDLLAGTAMAMDPGH